MDRKELYQLYRQFEQFLSDGRMTKKAVQQGKEQLMLHGYEGMIYGQTAAHWAQSLLELAKKHLDPEERVYLEPIEELIIQHKSVRDSCYI